MMQKKKFDEKIDEKIDEILKISAFHATLATKNWMVVVVSPFWNLMMTSMVRMKKKAKQAATAKTLRNLTMTFMLGIFNRKT